MSYTIKSGDTLSQLAQTNHTTVDALMQANPQIKDKNLIYAGAQLNIPGQSDSFQAGHSGGSSDETPDLGGTHSAQGSGSLGNAPPGQVGDWIKQAQQELLKAGVPADKMNAQDIATIIQHESSGNPNAQNNWDSNAKAGHPSIGLMQTIQPTFDAYKLPGHDNIRNPIDNIIAGVRYSIARYGSVSNVPGVQGLHNGSGYVGY